MSDMFVEGVFLSADCFLGCLWQLRYIGTEASGVLKKSFAKFISYLPVISWKIFDKGKTNKT